MKTLFDKQKVIGKAGERIFKDFFNGQKIQDVSEDKETQVNDDYDFIMNGLKIELKSSNTIADYDSITIEVYTDYDKRKIGWLYKSSADVFCFLDLKNLIIYACKAEELRQFYEDTKGKYKYKIYKAREYENSIEKSSLLCFIPLMDLQQNIQSWQVYKVNEL